MATATGATAGRAVPSGIVATIAGIRDLVTDYGGPVFDLCIRLWIADVFFLSGLTKLRDWNSTLFLFEQEYAVPVLPVPVAALLGTTCELLCPPLLVLGLMSRLSALPLIGMTLTIQYVLGARSPAYDSWEHFVWLVILLSIAIKGPGRLSLDHLIARRFGIAR